MPGSEFEPRFLFPLLYGQRKMALHIKRAACNAGRTVFHTFKVYFYLDSPRGRALSKAPYPFRISVFLY